MKRTKKIVWFFVLLSCILSECTPFEKRRIEPDKPFEGFSAERKWQLIWSDEFNIAGPLDSSVWGYEEGSVRNQELQHYTKSRFENVRIQNGALVIEARKERYRESEYTSASITTKGKLNFLYNRIEVRAKLPKGRGTWAAIFMLGSDIDKVGWPACGEIDIMESVGFNVDKIYATVHTRKYNHLLGTHKGAGISVPGASEDFNVYAVEWHENRIDFFANEKKYFTYSKENGDSIVWPFDKPQFLLINLAVGGTWGGAKGIDPHIFPQRFHIDYVRVYEMTGSGQE